MTEPIFKPIFANHWHSLPKVFHKHYANKPFCDDKTIAEGEMNIKYSFFARLILPILGLFKILVPYKGNNIKTKVIYSSKAKYFELERIFYFPNKKPYHFKSKILSIKANELVEIFNLNFCWRFVIQYKDDKVKLIHKAYCLKIFKRFIPLPLDFLIGKGYAEEIAVSDDEFGMKMHIYHKSFGTFFEYSGKFKITDYAK